VRLRLAFTFIAGASGIIVLAYAEPGASVAAVGGWVLLLAAFATLATMDDR